MCVYVFVCLVRWCAGAKGEQEQKYSYVSILLLLLLVLRLDPSGPKLEGPTGSNFGPTWVQPGSQLGSNLGLTGSNWVQPGSNLGLDLVGPKLDPVGPKVQLGPT